MPCLQQVRSYMAFSTTLCPQGTNMAIDADRITRSKGGEPGFVPVIDEDPLKPSALPTPDSYTFFSSWEKKSNWKNTVSLKS